MESRLDGRWTSACRLPSDERIATVDGRARDDRAPRCRSLRRRASGHRAHRDIDWVGLPRRGYRRPVTVQTQPDDKSTALTRAIGNITGALGSFPAILLS